MAFALRANCGPRWLSGFLTMFMAFLLRENPIEGWRPEVLFGIVIGAAGLGNTLGILTASTLRRINPAVTVIAALVIDGAMVLLCALFYGVVPLFLLGLTAGLSQSLAKVSLDSTIQSTVPTQVQASAFARSDTTLQLSWVIGGFVGIALPLRSPTSGSASPAPCSAPGPSSSSAPDPATRPDPPPRPPPDRPAPCARSGAPTRLVCTLRCADPPRVDGEVRRPASPSPPTWRHDGPGRRRTTCTPGGSTFSGVQTSRVGVLARAEEPGQSSSSSARARRSLATGAAVRLSGCRPWR